MVIKTKVFHNLTCHQHTLKSQQKKKYTVASEEEALCITQRNSSKENVIACWNQNAYWSANPYLHTKRKKMFWEQRTPSPPSYNFLAFCWHVYEMMTEGKAPPTWFSMYLVCILGDRLFFKSLFSITSDILGWKFMVLVFSFLLMRKSAF